VKKWLRQLKGERGKKRKGERVKKWLRQLKGERVKKRKGERMAAPTCLLTCQLVNQQGRKGG